MNKAEFREEIRELEEAGVIETEKTRDGEKIGFTENGLAATEFMIGMRADMQLFLFSLLWNNEYQNMDSPYEKLIMIGKDMRDKFELNIFRTLETGDNADKIEGIELLEDDLPEDFVQVFDP